MNRPHAVLATAVTLAASSTVPGAQSAPQTPQEVVSSFHKALARGDSATALALMDSDVIIYEGGGVESSRDEYRAHHLGADIAFAGNTKREVLATTTTESGDVAWVISTSRTSGTFRERDIRSRGAETMILRKTDEGWRIVHIHWSSRSERR
ncbi:MAG: YybH family protein [Gemmatimonadales bacterium]